MRFIKDKVVFVSSHRFNSNGKELCFVKLADPLTYDVLEIMPVRDFSFSGLVAGQVCSAEIDIQGRYSNLVSLKPNK
jgi:hypothetical protein